MLGWPGVPLIIALSLAAAVARAQNIHYLGNEGVLVAQGDAKILFDPFFEEDFGVYTLVPEAIHADVMAGRAPFDGVDAVFVSHIHPDHFSSNRMLAYLRAHPEVHLYATREVYDALRAAGVRATDPLMERLHSVYVPTGQPPQRVEQGGLKIEGYPIPHGPRPLNHMAFRVTLPGGFTVMHLGDAGGDDGFYAPHQADFDRSRLDLLLAPEWLLQGEAQRQVLETRLKPSTIIGIHFNNQPAPDVDRGGHKVFRTPGEGVAIRPD